MRKIIYHKKVDKYYPYIPKAFEKIIPLYLNNYKITNFYLEWIYSLSFVFANQGTKRGLYHNIMYHNKSVTSLV